MEGGSAELDLGAIRARLKEGAGSRDEKIDLVRQVVKHAGSAEMRSILNESLGTPANDDIREVLIRSFGYVKDKAAVRDVAPYLGDPDPRILVNAAKAIAELDPRQAVKRSRKRLIAAPSKQAYALAEVLAERCGAEAESLFMSLVVSRKNRHRALSLFYLKTLPASESVPILIEMLRRERKSGVRKLISRLLERKADVTQIKQLERFREELAAKAGEIAAVLIDLAPEPAAGPEVVGLPPRGGVELFEEYLGPEHSDSGGGSAGSSPGLDPLARAPSFDEEGVPVSGRFDLPELRGEKPPAPGIPPPAGFDEWKEKRRKKGPREESLLVKIPRGVDRVRRPVAVLVVLLLGAFLYSIQGEDAAPEAAAGPRQDSTLGNVGGPVSVSGKVASVQVDRRSLELRTKDGVSVVAYFPDWDISSAQADQHLAVDGVIRKIVTPKRILVLGHSTRAAEAEE